MVQFSVVAVLLLVWGVAGENRWGFSGVDMFTPLELKQLPCRPLIANFTSITDINPIQPELSEEWRQAFSFDGRVPLETYLVDDTNSSMGTHYVAGEVMMERLLQEANTLLREGKISGKGGPLATTKVFFLEAVKQYFNASSSTSTSSSSSSSFHGGPNVVVWGSTSPWYESIALAAGAASVTTIEYNRLTYSHPKLTTKQPHEVEHRLFDIAISTSSFDHNGLGRYGDPFDPFGDVRAMQLARCFLKPGGLMFFSVPVGPDVVVYNLHRRYGKLRLPSMLHKWDIVDIIGWEKGKLEEKEDFRKSYEPIFVLRKPLPRSKQTKPKEEL